MSGKQKGSEQLQGSARTALGGRINEKREHAEALQYALESADKRFGEGWREFSMAFKERDILVTVFTK
ncbi:MAG: hypothetical protein IKH28_06180 [Lachnospiraceae bacterium]|nr:hypothetical protein [Lachnospiraceae bacterium]